jgi:UDP-N-acetylglucosamine 1-carboxyvinyltransferase
MLGVFGKGKIVLNNAALEPEIDDLIRFLNLAGAKIKREGKKIYIEGISKLHANSPFSIMSDRNEAVTFITLACATKSEITISNISRSLIDSFLKKLKEANASVTEHTANQLGCSSNFSLKATKLETSPHPGFMTDWQPNWAVLMTQANGESFIYERVFENRFSYVNELRKLGAQIDFVKPPVNNPQEYFFFNFDPNKKYNQAIRIVGPQKLHGGALTIFDLRAGATLAIAALIAEGESIVNGVSILNRGYENFTEKIINLGGDIKQV